MMYTCIAQSLHAAAACSVRSVLLLLLTAGWTSRGAGREGGHPGTPREVVLKDASAVCPAGRYADPALGVEVWQNVGRIVELRVLQGWHPMVAHPPVQLEVVPVHVTHLPLATRRPVHLQPRHALSVQRQSSHPTV